jgi:hypothetical protein
MDRKAFFDAVRTPLFGGKISLPQVQGMEAVLNEWDSNPGDARWLAYMLATDYHETAKTMQPVRETLASSDDRAIAILDAAWKKGKMPRVKTAYWRKDAQGHSWLGRGLVQLTHKDNYVKFGLDGAPEKAMEMATAVKVMFVGMTAGLFTGKKLSDFIHGGVCDWVGARKIINGTDKDTLIAGYAKAFYAALQASGA